MSSKRMLSITVFGVAFIVLFIGVMLLTPYLSHDAGELPLPESESPTQTDNETADSALLNRVEVTRDNVQDVITMLLQLRPESYTRDIIIESFWDGSSAVYNIESAVSGDIMSLKVSGGGIVKRIIVTPNTLYIWNDGDTRPLTRGHGPDSDWRRVADEWQMLPTYADVLSLPKSAITDAGYIDYGGEECIYVTSKSGRLGYTSRYYISVTLGLLVGVEEYDGNQQGSPQIYKMAATGYGIGVPDETVFLLPNGSSARPVS